MRAAAAEYDREIQLLERANVRDATFNTDSPVWLPRGTVFAQVRDVLPSRADSLAEGVDLAKRPCRVRIRWDDALFDLFATGKLRLKIRGHELRVVSGPAELGRREAIELTAEELSTEGQRP